MIKEVSKNPDKPIFEIWINDNKVGYAKIIKDNKLLNFLPLPHTCWIIDELIIDFDERKKGYGTILLQHILMLLPLREDLPIIAMPPAGELRKGEELEIVEVTSEILRSLPINKEYQNKIINWYKKHGFKQTKYYLIKI